MRRCQPRNRARMHSIWRQSTPSLQQQVILYRVAALKAQRWSKEHLS